MLKSAASLICLLVCSSAHLSAAVIWQIGLDNNNTLASEMDPEFQADDFFYLDPGDYRTRQGYTGISTLAFGVDRTGMSPELVADGLGNDIGFERALTSGDPATNVFFQLSAAQLADGYLKFTVDFNKPSVWADPAPGPIPNASTDVTIYFNGVVIGTISDMVDASLFSYTVSNSAVNAVTGSNVISLVRTGDGVPAGWVSSFVVMDYLRLESVPEPSRAIMSALAIGLCFFRRRRSGC